MEQLPQPSDAELLVGSRSEIDLFGELYDRNIDGMLGYFMRRTGCAQTAADLAAETFAQAFTSRHRFVDTGAPAQAWLFKIAGRQLSRFRRTERVSERARRRLGVTAEALSSDDIDRVEALIDFVPVQEALRAAVADLPVKQSEALTLRVGNGLSYAEVAGRLGCTEGAARVRVSRGLARLTEVMGEPR